MDSDPNFLYQFLTDPNFLLTPISLTPISCREIRLRNSAERSDWAQGAPRGHPRGSQASTASARRLRDLYQADLQVLRPKGR